MFSTAAAPSYGPRSHGQLARATSHSHISACCFPSFQSRPSCPGGCEVVAGDRDAADCQPLKGLSCASWPFYVFSGKMKANTFAHF